MNDFNDKEYRRENFKKKKQSFKRNKLDNDEYNESFLRRNKDFKRKKKDLLLENEDDDTYEPY